MTTPPASNIPVTTVTSNSPFGREEQAALEQDDVQAGKIIGRLLCFFFLYTIVVTILAAWWTWDAIR